MISQTDDDNTDIQSDRRSDGETTDQIAHIYSDFIHSCVESTLTAAMPDGIITTLSQINDDCLVHIFRQLNVREQYMLHRLSVHFRWAILHIWRSKYHRQLDMRATTDLLLLAKDDLTSALSILLKCCTALLNVNANACEALVLLAARQPFLQFQNIAKLSIDAEDDFVQLPMSVLGMFPHLHSIQLRRCSLPTLKVLNNYRELNDLRLYECTFSPRSEYIESEWHENEIDKISQQMHLETFCSTPEPLAHSTPQMGGIRHILQRSCIKHCTHTLHTLQLNAGDLMAVIRDALQLLKLERLTIYTHSQAHDAAAHKCISAALKTEAIASKRMYSLRIKCHFDGNFLQQLLPLPNLRIFAWHSHLHVEHGPGGEIKWQTYDRSMEKRILAFIEACTNLNCLDFRWNVHVNDAFLYKAQRALHSSGVQLFNSIICDANFKWHSHTTTIQAESLRIGFYEFEFE